MHTNPFYFQSKHLYKRNKEKNQVDHSLNPNTYIVDQT